MRQTLNATPTFPQSGSIGDPNDLMRATAEVEVDRILRTILESLRADKTCVSLRAALLEHVLAGRESSMALLMLPRNDAEEARDARLLRIEAGLVELLGRPDPTGIVLQAGASIARAHAVVEAAAAPPHPVPPDGAGLRGAEPVRNGTVAAPAQEPAGEGAADLFAASGPKEQAAAPTRATRSPAAEVASTKAGPATGGQATPARTDGGTKLPAARRPAGAETRLRDGRPVSVSNNLSEHLRMLIAALAVRLGRPVSIEDVLEGIPAKIVGEIRKKSTRYLNDVLKRSCIRIGEDLFWPMDVEIPASAALTGEWARAIRSGRKGSLPEATQAKVEGAKRIVDAFNVDVDDPAMRIVVGEEYSTTTKSRMKPRHVRRR